MHWAFVLAIVFLGSNAFNIPENTIQANSLIEGSSALSDLCDDVARKFEKEYVNYMKSGVESHALSQISQHLAKSHTRQIMTAEIEDLSIANQIFMCTTCRATTNILIRMFRPGGEMAALGDDVLRETAIELCIRFDIQTKEICEGIIQIFFPLAKFLVKESKIDSRTFCGTFLHASICKVSNTDHNWKLNIDPNGPTIEGPKSEIPKKGDNDLTILQVTDVHYDPLYDVGALADCDETVCCQLYKNISQGTPKAAGYWGDYRNCDTPWHTIADSLKQIKENHKNVDFVYHTGDVVDHASWLGSREKNVESLKKVYQELKSTFSDIPVYPTIGNHDSHPAHSYAPPSVTDEYLTTQWLYNLHADLWSVWLPASTQETIKKGGYYTVSPRTGFRIIALNNNDCYTLNFWILYDTHYSSEQLQWLHDVLLQAEKDGEYVHILAHIPSGVSSCWDIWSREFSRIVVRFSKTISGIFNGHTHTDELSLYYSKQTDAVNVAWNGGSLTTFNSKNPNYKIYQVEPTSFQVVEQEAWFFNLTAANLKPEESPKWELEYKLTEEFELKDLSPASVDELLTKFAENPPLLRKYWRMYVIQSDPLLKKGCDADCLKDLICRLARGDNTQTKRCQILRTTLQAMLDIEEPEPEPGGDGEGDGGGDGAASNLALKMTTLFCLYLGVKLLL